MPTPVRVRFAPSPTGGLHLGGMRTVLYNYLFAKKHNGTFILRIEDTDQSRFVSGAEEYIFDCLAWTGMEPDESIRVPGKHGPYRQSERKHLYRQYADKLVKDGNAYIAFDTPAELEKMRHDFKTDQNPTPQYDQTIRLKMRNSLSLPADEVKKLLDNKTPYVIRIKMPAHESVTFNDMIRGDVRFDTSIVDDKVLLKADGMPTYHLAVVVDDHLMEITHAFRGEEWLPSAPVHILLWQYLFGLERMPQWAHLPLILGPNGKLSKRDGMKYGFPVFAMTWKDPNTGEVTEGFREKGFLPQAFINLLALLGWNDGTEKEIFSKKELIDAFSMDRVHNSGAKFDYEKAKWFNHQWMQRLGVGGWRLQVKSLLEEKDITGVDENYLEKVINLVKERCHLLTDIYDQSWFFFKSPDKWDTESVLPKWNADKKNFFDQLINDYSRQSSWNASELESTFKSIALAKNIKPGDLQLPLRVMLVGGKFGPPVFVIAETIGKDETVSRIRKALEAFDMSVRSA